MLLAWLLLSETVIKMDYPNDRDVLETFDCQYAIQNSCAPPPQSQSSKLTSYFSGINSHMYSSRSKL